MGTGRVGCGSSIMCRLAIVKTFNFLSRRAAAYDRMVASLLINGAMNGETFRAYIEQFVVPILNRNDIVAIDNLPAHNVAGIEEAIIAVGATLRICRNIHPTSTRSNRLTANSRRTCASLPQRTAPTLHRAIRSFPAHLGLRECAHYYKHAGYAAI